MLRVDLNLRGDIEADLGVELARLVLRQPWLPDAPPDYCAVDGKRADDTRWHDALNSRFQRSVSVAWSSANFFVKAHSTLGLVMGPDSDEEPPHEVSLRDLIKFLMDAPLEWGFLEDTRGYSTQRFGADRKLGALIFFKGRHVDARLVSRRWLEHGPWLARRYPNDLHVVYFHDLDVPDETKAQQCKAAHSFLFDGFYGKLGAAELPEHAVYLPERRALEVSVYGRPISGQEMRNTRRIVLRQGLGADKPLDKATYTFADPDEARALLHELWLRQIEVVTFIDGKRIVLTDDYAPDPAPPPWTKALLQKLEAEGL